MSAPRPQRLVVIAGTATEVGKTWVAARLVEELRSHGLRVAARKPAQSFEAGDDPAATDAGLLAAATGESPHDVCPPHRWYPVAMAPPMAADALGREPLHMADLIGEVDAGWPTPSVDVGLVELAGGPWSPMTHDGDGIDATRMLRPDAVVLVADAGLGTLNAVRPATRALGDVAPTVVHLNRYNDTVDLHRRNRDWLTEHEGTTVTVTIDELAALQLPLR